MFMQESAIDNKADSSKSKSAKIESSVKKQKIQADNEIFILEE